MERAGPTPHDLRHTGEGANPWVLAEILGHGDTRVTDLFEKGDGYGQRRLREPGIHKYGHPPAVVLPPEPVCGWGCVAAGALAADHEPCAGGFAPRHQTNPRPASPARMEPSWRDLKQGIERRPVYRRRLVVAAGTTSQRSVMSPRGTKMSTPLVYNQRLWR